MSSSKPPAQSPEPPATQRGDAPSRASLIVALIGRPNVGKSTLFNRLIGQRSSVVSSGRGTTRDRLYGTIRWNGIPLTLVDTGGRDFAATGGVGAAVQAHIRYAVEEADMCILVCDGPAGPVPADQMILDELRQHNTPVIVAVNKLDQRLQVPPDFFSLGASPVVPISALHGVGTSALLDQAAAQPMSPARAASSDRAADAEWSVAIVGRQNVGKSSLLNKLLGEERAIVSEAPGTTRDAVDTVGRFRGHRVRLIDTAGLRHRRKVKQPVDTFAMMRTRQAIARCDVALMLLDATLGVADDDRRIINAICEAGCGLVLVANKWDLLKDGSEQTLLTSLRRLLPSAAFAPVAAVSAKTGFQVEQCLEMAQRVVQTLRRGIPEEVCVKILRRAWARHLPPRYLGRAIRLQRAQWVPGRPPRLVLTTAPLGKLPQPYQHYLLKQLHAHPGFLGVPIRLALNGPGQGGRR